MTNALEIQKSYRDCVPNFAEYVDLGIYDAGQLCAIRYGLENGFDVSSYAKPEYSAEYMHAKFLEMKVACRTKYIE